MHVSTHTMEKSVIYLVLTVLMAYVTDIVQYVLLDAQRDMTGTSAI